MKKRLIIVFSIIIVMLILVGAMFIFNKQTNKNIKLENANDIKNMIQTIYSDLTSILPSSLETQEINLNDDNMVSSYTGLKNSENIETLVVSEPLMSSQAYSLVVIKLKNGTNVEATKQEIYNNINMNKWICVSAEKLYITNYNNIIFAIMASEDWAKPIYNSFKTYVENNIGKELEKSENAEYELAPEIILQ